MPLQVAEAYRNIPVYVVFPTTRHEGREGEQRYNSPLSLTSALDRGGWSTSRPGRFNPEKDPVPTVQVAGWIPWPVWTGTENLDPSGFDPRTIQTVASRYTDCAIRPYLKKRDLWVLKGLNLLPCTLHCVSCQPYLHFYITYYKIT